MASPFQGHMFISQNTLMSQRGFLEGRGSCEVRGRPLALQRARNTHRVEVDTSRTHRVATVGSCRGLHRGWPRAMGSTWCCARVGTGRQPTYWRPSAPRRGGGGSPRRRGHCGRCGRADRLAHREPDRRADPAGSFPVSTVWHRERRRRPRLPRLPATVRVTRSVPGRRSSTRPPVTIGAHRRPEGGANVGGRRWPLARSNAWAIRISVGSLQARPMNETPTGSPKANPAGTDTLG